MVLRINSWGLYLFFEGAHENNAFIILSILHATHLTFTLALYT